MGQAGDGLFSRLRTFHSSLLSFHIRTLPLESLNDPTSTTAKRPIVCPSMSLCLNHITHRCKTRRIYQFVSIVSTGTCLILSKVCMDSGHDLFSVTAVAAAQMLDYRAFR